MTTTLNDIVGYETTEILIAVTLCKKKIYNIRAAFWFWAVPTYNYFCGLVFTNIVHLDG